MPRWCARRAIHRANRGSRQRTSILTSRRRLDGEGWQGNVRLSLPHRYRRGFGPHPPAGFTSARVQDVERADALISGDECGLCRSRLRGPGPPQNFESSGLMHRRHRPLRTAQYPVRPLARPSLASITASPIPPTPSAEESSRGRGEEVMLLAQRRGRRVLTKPCCAATAWLVDVGQPAWARAGESLFTRRPPKEQPPRNLSGTTDRAGLIDTLESVPSRSHRRGKPGAVRQGVKALRLP